MIVINSYIIAFPTISMANRANSLLRASGYSSYVGRTPPGLLKSCAYGLYMDTADIEKAAGSLANYGVKYSGLLIKRGEKYVKIR